METLRCNIMAQAHKRLRSDLNKVAFSIQQTSFRNREEAEQTIEKIRSILNWLENYQEVKERLVYLTLQEEDAAFAGSFKKDKISSLALTNQLIEAIEEYGISDSDNKRLNTGIKILLAYNQWVTAVEEEINQEETMLNLLFWDNGNDWIAEGVVTEIGKQVPRVEKEFERGGQLVQTKQSTPVHVWRRFLQMAKQELQLDKWTWFVREMFADKLARV